MRIEERWRSFKQHSFSTLSLYFHLIVLVLWHIYQPCSHCIHALDWSLVFVIFPTLPFLSSSPPPDSVHPTFLHCISFTLQNWTTGLGTGLVQSRPFSWTRSCFLQRKTPNLKVRGSDTNWASTLSLFCSVLKESEHISIEQGAKIELNFFINDGVDLWNLGAVLGSLLKMCNILLIALCKTSSITLLITPM